MALKSSAFGGNTRLAGSFFMTGFSGIITRPRDYGPAERTSHQGNSGKFGTDKQRGVRGTIYPLVVTVWNVRNAKVAAAGP